MSHLYKTYENGYMYILYTQVRVNKRTALRGGPLDTAGGGGVIKVCSADGADINRFDLIT